MKREGWIGIALVALYLLAGVIDPCDGHSCKGEQWTNSGTNTNSN